jgi:hypothetical protein
MVPVRYRRIGAKGTTSVMPLGTDPTTRKAQLLELCARIGFTPPHFA